MTATTITYHCSCLSHFLHCIKVYIINKNSYSNGGHCIILPLPAIWTLQVWSQLIGWLQFLKWWALHSSTSTSSLDIAGMMTADWFIGRVRLQITLPTLALFKARRNLNTWCPEPSVPCGGRQLGTTIISLTFLASSAVDWTHDAELSRLTCYQTNHWRWFDQNRGTYNFIEENYGNAVCSKYGACWRI